MRSRGINTGEGRSIGWYRSPMARGKSTGEGKCGRRGRRSRWAWGAIFDPPPIRTPPGSGVGKRRKSTAAGPWYVEGLASGAVRTIVVRPASRGGKEVGENSSRRGRAGLLSDSNDNDHAWLRCQEVSSRSGQIDHTRTSPPVKKGGPVARDPVGEFVRVVESHKLCLARAFQFAHVRCDKSSMGIRQVVSVRELKTN
jgi:hypothetical protein